MRRAMSRASAVEMFLRHTEQAAQMQYEQGFETNNATMESETRYDLAQINDNNIDICLNSIKPEDKSLQIYDNEFMKNSYCKKIIVTMDDTKTHMKNETAEKTAIDTKKISARRGKKNNLTSDKKENLKKINHDKIIKKQKVTRKLKKTPGTSSLNICKQTNEELTQGRTKLNLYEIDARKYLQKTVLPHFSCIRPNNTNNMYDANISYSVAAKRYELNQYSLDSNQAALQYLDHNDMRFANQQQVMLIKTDPWSMASRNHQNFAFNNVPNVQNGMERRDYMNDKQYCTCAAVDYNWKQNLYSNSYLNTVNSINPYMLPHLEDRAYLRNISGTHWMWNNYTSVDNSLNANAVFQATNNTSNYVMSAATSNNFTNATAELCNSFYPQTDFRKLRYMKCDTINYANGSGCEVMSMVKENIISPFHDMYHVNPLAPSNNLNIPFNASTSRSDVLSSYPLYTDNACVQDSSNQYNYRDVIRTNISNDQHREKDNFNPYMESANILSANDMQESNPYKTDELMGTLSHQDSTTTTDNNIISDIISFISEMNSVDVPEEFTSYICAMKKDLISNTYTTTNNSL